MSNPTRPTQQQLDELEALMQRMLALPVNQLEDEPASASSLASLPPLPEWESAPDEPSLLSLEKPAQEETTGHEDPEEETDVVAVAERVLPALSPPPTSVKEVPPARAPQNQELEPPDMGRLPEPVLPVLRTPIVVRPLEEDKGSGKPGDRETNKIAGRAIQPAKRIERPRRERPAWWLRPLLWSNRTFDRHVGQLGSVGHWLRGRYGRAFLGLTGLLLLAAALVLGALDWIGWTW